MVKLKKLFYFKWNHSPGKGELIGSKAWASVCVFWVTHEILFTHLNIPPQAPTCSCNTQYVGKMAKSTAPPNVVDYS